MPFSTFTRKELFMVTYTEYVLIRHCTLPNSDLVMYQGNVLLDSEFHCQVTDFGLTRHFDATVMQSTKTFAPNFAAPELFGMCSECCQLMCEGCGGGHDAHKRKTMETDVYAFGCLYYAVRLNY